MRAVLILSFRYRYLVNEDMNMSPFLIARMVDYEAEPEEARRTEQPVIRWPEFLIQFLSASHQSS